MFKLHFFFDARFPGQNLFAGTVMFGAEGKIHFLLRNIDLNEKQTIRVHRSKTFHFGEKL